MQPEHIDVPDQAPPGPGLSPWARSATLALAEAVFSTNEGPPTAERLAWLADELDHFLSYAGSRARFSYLLCLVGVAVAAPLTARRLPPLQALPLAERLAALEHLERSPFALALFGAKTVLCLMYYEHPDAPREGNFDPGCMKGAAS